MTPPTRRPILYASLICFALALLLLAACVGSSQAACNGYEVQPNDGLYRISVNHGETLAQLLADNGLTQYSVIHPGDCLRVSGATGTAAYGPNQIPTYASQNSLQFAGQTFALDEIAAWEQNVPRNDNFHRLIWSQRANNLVFSAHSDEAGAYLYRLDIGDAITLTPNGRARTFAVTRNDTVITNFFGSTGSWFYMPDTLKMITCYEPGDTVIGRQVVTAEAVK